MSTKQLLKGAFVSALGFLVAAMLGVAAPAQAGSWKSHAADFDFGGECATGASASGGSDSTDGGRSCYTKTVFVGWSNVLRVTWSTTGDAHGGAKIWITCVIKGSSGPERFCTSPGVATGGASGAPLAWITVQNLPDTTTTTNCNDGGGGAADCHDNSIHYTWCAPIRAFDVYTIELRLASSSSPPMTGLGTGVVWVEDSTFFIDSTRIHNSNRCVQRSP